MKTISIQTNKDNINIKAAVYVRKAGEKKPASVIDKTRYIGVVSNG